MSDLEKAKKLINDYSINEFGIEEDFENLSEIPVAYTTCDDEEKEYVVTYWQPLPTAPWDIFPKGS